MVIFVCAPLSVRHRLRLVLFVVVAAFHPRRLSLFSERILSEVTVAFLILDARPSTRLYTLTSLSSSRLHLFAAAFYFYRCCRYVFASPAKATNRALASPATLLVVDSKLSKAMVAK